QLAFGLADELDAFGGRRIAVRRVDDLIVADIELVLARDRGNLPRRTDQYRDNDAGFRGFHGATQRGFITLMDNARRRGRALFRPADQPFILSVSLVSDRRRGFGMAFSAN